MIVALLYAWAVAAALQLVLWLVQLRTRNAAIVDVGWAASFTLVAGVFAWRAEVPASSWLPIAIVVVAWSLRLAGHLAARGAAGRVEEGRYVELRRRWTPHAARSFFVFFQAQAALVAVLATAFVVPFFTAPWDSGWLRALGVVVAAIAIVGETLADLQLARFKRARRGAVCDVGLWAYSRHPNYFFEWCFWMGLAVYGLAFDQGWIAVGAQAVILASIWKVTGIPATEAQALRSKGDAYRAYQRRVSAFVPRPPRRAS